MGNLILKGNDLTSENVKEEVEKRIGKESNCIRVLFAVSIVNQKIESRLTIQKNNNGDSNVYDMRNMDSPLSLKGVDSIEFI